jgi:CheY-like chemotaxis protein
VLLCEDNYMNQQLICDHLAKVGLSVVVAGDGSEGVDIVKERVSNDKKPFDLIFMDIHMPLMDGLEAASIISALGVKTPIVALTANIMVNDLDSYAHNGMSGHLGKPFTSQQFWRCLLNFLTPVGFSASDRSRRAADEAELRRVLKHNFVTRNQQTFAEITGALAANDIKLAHRLAHTLKGNAGQIGEGALQTAAADTEAALSAGEPVEGLLGILETELSAVLEKLAPLLARAETPPPTADNARLLALTEGLEELLADNNTECLDRLDELRKLEGTEELVKHMEDFSFEKALEVLRALRIAVR